MRINITAGECLNNLIKSFYQKECFVPFNEAMIEGTYTSPPFSDEFIRERVAVHKTSETEYREKPSLFINFLKRINEYSEIVLWFGDEPFCRANSEFVMKVIFEAGFCGEVTLNTVNESTGEILKCETVFRIDDKKETVWPIQ